jgi:hypothetical protein
VTIPITRTETITSFTKCSTPIKTYHDTTYYSTYLTQTIYTTEYETTSCITYYPQPTVVPTHPGHQVCTDCYPATTITGPSYPGNTCAPPQTVISTYVITVTAGGNGGNGGNGGSYYTPTYHSEAPYPTGGHDGPTIPPYGTSSYVPYSTGAPVYSSEAPVYSSAAPYSSVPVYQSYGLSSDVYGTPVTSSATTYETIVN